jgi:hypothetical protein
MVDLRASGDLCPQMQMLRSQLHESSSTQLERFGATTFTAFRTHCCCPPGDAQSEGARAALDRRRKSFVDYSLKVLREVVRAIRAGDVDAHQ